MKRIYTYTASIAATMLLLFSACTGMQDDIQEYLDRGETIYVGKVVAVAHPGKNRIMIEAMMPYGMTQTHCVFSWKSPTGKVEAKSFDIERKTELDVFQFMLEPLEEGQHDFKVVTKDASGNSSIIIDVGGYSFGEVYQSTLDNREINNIKVSDDDNQNVEVNWLSINNIQFEGCNIEYEKSDGTIGKVHAAKDAQSTILPLYKAQGNMKWNSSYLPDSLAIDKFVTEWNEMKLP